MRSRATAVSILLALTVGALIASTAVAHAAPDTAILAQEDAQPNEDTDVQGGEGQDEGGAGQDDPDAETGASEEETEGGTSTETGPPWTYQMARITLVLLVFLALGLGYLYYRLVASRRSGRV